MSHASTTKASLKSLLEHSSERKNALLRDRSYMLAQTRAFFAKRYVLEVDCPILSPAASVDAHIDLISALYAQRQTYYMHSSPEYGMKRLLADGIGDIYQLSHVFRDGESSPKHSPEFMMVEWYRIGMSFPQLIEETLDYTRLFFGNIPHKIITYRDAFQRYAGIDYFKSTEEDLKKYLKQRGLETDSSMEDDGKDALLNIILALVIEPHLGTNELCALAYYPSSQAALAQVQWHGDEPVAERFEIYYKGVELCNGYHELTDSKEQRTRFIESNKERQRLGKKPLPIDEEFLKALEKGIPDCSGVAVGFDRLMMLRHKCSDISDIVPIPWL